MAELPWTLLLQGSGLGAFLLLVAFIVAGYRRLSQDGEATYQSRVSGLQQDLVAVRAAAVEQSERHNRDIGSVRARLVECRQESHELLDTVEGLRLELIEVRAELAQLRADRRSG